MGVRLFVKIRLLEGGWIKYCCDVTNMVFTGRPAERKGDILHPCAFKFSNAPPILYDKIGVPVCHG